MRDCRSHPAARASGSNHAPANGQNEEEEHAREREGAPGHARARCGRSALVLRRPDGDQGRRDHYALAEQLFPQGVETPLHVHTEDDETFYVLEGEVTFFAGDERIAASAGSVVHAAKGTPHGYRVESQTVRMLDVTTPQHVAFFRAVGDPAPELAPPPSAEPDMDRVMAAVGPYKIEILGPLPT